MTIRAELADGTVLEFPDGTHPDIIDHIVAGHVSGSHPVGDGAAMPQDDSALAGAALGAAKPIDNLVSAATSMLPQGLVQAVDSAGAAFGMPSAQDAVAGNEAAREANTRTGWQTAGNIAGTLPTLALPGGPLVQGGATGALLTDKTDPVGVGVDMLAGAAGNKVGDVALRGLSSAIAPRVAEAVRVLRDAGINLTPGQLGRGADSPLGNALAWAEDRATSLPFVGPAISEARDKTLDSFNRAVVRDVLKPIRRTLPDAVETGHQAVAHAQDAISTAYNNALAGVTGTFDSTFGNRIKAIAARTRLPTAQAEELGRVIKDEVGFMFEPGMTFTGKSLAKVRTRLDKLATAWSKSDNPYENELGEAVGKIRDEALAMVRRQNPDKASALRGADAAFARIVRLEKAARNAVDGVFTPGQYKTAVSNSSRSKRGRDVAAGKALGQELSNAASKLLPSKVGDSGTFTRSAQSNILANVLGAITAVPYRVAAAVAPVFARDAGPVAQNVGRGITVIRPAAANTLAAGGVAAANE